MLSRIIDLKILDTTDVKLQGEDLFPYLIIIATFQSRGNLPLLNDFLKIIDRGILISAAASFNTLGGAHQVQ